MRRIALFAFLLLSSINVAWAQSGQLGAGQVSGNPTASAGPARPSNVTSVFDQAFCNTSGSLLQRGASNWACVSSLIEANDAFFASGRPWADVMGCGAVNDGVTDSTAAINICLANLSALGGGDLKMPPGTGICTFTGVTLPALVRMVGTGGSRSASILSACGHDTTVVTLSNVSSAIESMQIVGGIIGTTKPAVKLTSSRAQIRWSDISGGTSPVQAVGAADAFLMGNRIRNGYGQASFLVQTSSGMYTLRNIFNMSYPGGTPAVGTNFAAWQAAHTYTAGTVVSTGGYYIQATVGGTSAGSSPTVLSYSTNITDNTVTWQLVSPTTYYGIDYDTGASVPYEWGNDHSGAMTAGVGMTNSLSGTAPQAPFISGGDFGFNYLAAIYAHDGNELTVTGNQTGACINTGCANVDLNSNFTGDVSISSNMMFGGPIGIRIGAGTNTAISANNIAGTTTTAIQVAANVSKFNIIGGNFGSTGQTNNNGVTIAAGTSDYYTIVGNVFNGVTGTPISDGGSGTHKTLEQSGAWSGMALSGSANTFTSIPNSALTNPATTVGGQTCTLGSTCTVRSTFGSGTANGLAQATTSFVGINQSFQSTELMAAPVSFAGTLKNMYWNSGTTPTGGQNITLTLRVGAYGALADTSVTCVISNPATACSDLTHTAAITAGQVWDIKAVTSATSGTLTGASWSIEMDQ